MPHMWTRLHRENQLPMRGPSQTTVRIVISMMVPLKALLQCRVVRASEKRTTPTNTGCHQPHPPSKAAAAATNPMAAAAHSAPNTRMPPSPRSQRPPSRSIEFSFLFLRSLRPDVLAYIHVVDDLLDGEHRPGSALVEPGDRGDNGHRIPPNWAPAWGCVDPQGLDFARRTFVAHRFQEAQHPRLGIEARNETLLMLVERHH